MHNFLEETRVIDISIPKEEVLLSEIVTKKQFECFLGGLKDEELLNEFAKSIDNLEKSDKDDFEAFIEPNKRIVIACTSNYFFKLFKHIVGMVTIHVK